MNLSTQFLVRFTHAALIFFGLAMTAGPARAQLVTFSKQDLVDYSAQNPFERFPDGRPKVPDNLVQQARELSSEEVWAVVQEKGFNNQYADGFRILERPWHAFSWKIDGDLRLLQMVAALLSVMT